MTGDYSMKIKNHKLQGGVKYKESPNHGGEFAPDTIIIHYTAGPSAESAINTFADPDKKVSAHLIVDFNGSITQMAPFNTVAWHAGKSRHKDRIGLNNYAIGIEIVNAGRLTRSGSKYVSWFGREYAVEEVMKAIHRNEDTATYWQRYTEKQITIVSEICSDLVKEYGIEYILGHEEISPGRKIDPGPAFPLDKLRNRILQIDVPKDDQDIDDYEKDREGIVSAGKLNIRSGPSTARAKVAEPLPQGKKVSILEKHDGWYRVSVEIKGWVSSEFIRQI
jgi:N-acetylmuramoyl-L-alanine amidase